MKLIGYDFEIEYKPRKENKAVDALFQVKVGGELKVMISTQVLETSSLLKEIEEDKGLQTLTESILKDPGHKPSYVVEHGRLIYKRS